MRETIRAIFTFPDPVNEVSARLVAGGVASICILTVAGQIKWLVPGIAYGFVARVLAGPTLSPLAQLVTRVITPRLYPRPRPVPGPPKRFAQAIGATLSLTATVLLFGFGQQLLAFSLIGAIATAATLEATLGFCVGCKIFYALIRWGAIPGSVCERCARSALEPR